MNTRTTRLQYELIMSGLFWVKTLNHIDSIDCFFIVRMPYTFFPILFDKTKSSTLLLDNHLQVSSVLIDSLLFFFTFIYQELFLFPRVDRKPFVTVIYYYFASRSWPDFWTHIYLLLKPSLLSVGFSLIRIFHSFLSKRRKNRKEKY